MIYFLFYLAKLQCTARVSHHRAPIWFNINTHVWTQVPAQFLSLVICLISIILTWALFNLTEPIRALWALYFLFTLPEMQADGAALTALPPFALLPLSVPSLLSGITIQREKKKKLLWQQTFLYFFWKCYKHAEKETDVPILSCSPSPHPAPIGSHCMCVRVRVCALQFPSLIMAYD